jgi:hypothetical protein
VDIEIIYAEIIKGDTLGILYTVSMYTVFFSGTKYLIDLSFKISGRALTFVQYGQ